MNGKNYCSWQRQQKESKRKDDSKNQSTAAT